MAALSLTMSDILQATNYHILGFNIESKSSIKRSKLFKKTFWLV